MQSSEFFAFPKTPHLAGSAVVDDDEVVDETALRYLLDHSEEDGLTVLVQEKMDGTNVSVYFEEEWSPVLQKRSGLITSGEKAQYDVFRGWVYERMDDLYALLGRRQYVLFGEWLWCQHAVHYDKLPSFFLAFDLFVIAERRFLSYDRMVQVIGGRVPVVPLLWSSSSSTAAAHGKFEELKKFIGQETIKRNSTHGSEAMEGVYVRIEQSGWVKDRFKMRRKTFIAGREGFTTNIKNNSLASEPQSSASSSGSKSASASTTASNQKAKPGKKGASTTNHKGRS